MVLMQEREPRAFKSDRAFWVQTSRRFRGLGTRHAVKYLGKGGRVHRVYRDPNQQAAVTLGRWLVEAVGVLGINIHRAATAELDAQAQALAAVHAASKMSPREQHQTTRRAIVAAEVK
jgi:hypothetical protein